MATARTIDELLEEFAAAPFGRHSTELRLLLNRLRSAPLVGKYCLIARVPHVSWQLARMSGVRGEAPTPVAGVYFSSLLEAEINITAVRARDQLNRTAAAAP
jgi:hypothetical protein